MLRNASSSFRPRRAVWLIGVPLVLVASLLVAWQSYASAGASRAHRSRVTTLISKSKLAQLGLGRGPDSTAARYVAPNGRSYLVFTASTKGSPHGPYRLYRMPLGKNDSAASVSIAGKPQLVLSHGSAEPNPVPWCATQCFDKDYSGGGTLLHCPNNGPLLMAYHGENHTDPQGEFVPHEGWSGIGLARWDPSAQRFVKIDQIIGLNTSNRWRHTATGWETWQAPPLAYQADMVQNPRNGMVYLYYGDKLFNPDPYKGARIAMAAISRTTLCANAAAGVHSTWLKWFNGSFSQPGVNTSAAANGHLPAGTGGRFTPILNKGGETSPNVVYRRGTWYMVTGAGHSGINLRTSSDGIHWSDPREVYKPDHGYLMYPYLWIPRGKGRTAYVTFTWHQFPRPAKGNCALQQAQITL